MSEEYDSGLDVGAGAFLGSYGCLGALLLFLLTVAVVAGLLYLVADAVLDNGPAYQMDDF